MQHTPGIAAKRGLASALRSQRSAFKPSEHFDKQPRPALQALLDTAIAAKEARADVGRRLTQRSAKLCMAANDKNPGQGGRMVALLNGP
jgi:hypothetical protein